MTVKRIGIGLRAQKGGAVVVGVVIEDGAPQLLFSTMLPTHAEGDRLSLEPYHVAAEAPRDRAEALVAEGRAKQDRLAADNLATLVDGFGSDIVAGLLVNRAGWVTDVLDYSLGWPEHLPVAEGLAVRDALRFALKRSAIETVELDEKSLPDRAGWTLSLSHPEIEARLKVLGAGLKPWRKEQKAAALASWIVAAGEMPKN